MRNYFQLKKNRLRNFLCTPPARRNGIGVNYHGVRFKNVHVLAILFSRYFHTEVGWICWRSAPVKRVNIHCLSRWNDLDRMIKTVAKSSTLKTPTVVHTYSRLFSLVHIQTTDRQKYLLPTAWKFGIVGRGRGFSANDIVVYTFGIKLKKYIISTFAVCTRI